MLDVRFDVPAGDFSTMRVGGTFAQFVTITAPEEIEIAAQQAAAAQLPLRILGGGSNCVFGDTKLPYFFAHMCIDGITIEQEDEASVLISCGAGVMWDSLVAWSVERGFAGIEALSWIPGTAGAAPVQNIGAYGAEFADVAYRIEFFDLTTNTFSSFTKRECDFKYRISIFKQEPNQRVISRIVICLSKLEPPQPTHLEILKELETAPDEEKDLLPLLLRIRNAVIAVRSRKLPDPNIIPNCGSFFMNPIVSLEQVSTIKHEFPDMPQYSAVDGAKLSAGWLIERAGYKGFVRGATGTHEKHALVIVNRGGATGEDIKTTAHEIAEAVFNRFGIRLVPEVNFIF